MKNNRIVSIMVTAIMVIAFASISTVTTLAASHGYDTTISMAPGSILQGNNRSYNYANFECDVTPKSFDGNNPRKVQATVGKIIYILGIAWDYESYSTKLMDIPNVNTKYNQKFGNVGKGTRNFTFRTIVGTTHYAGFTANPVVLNSYS